MLNDYRLPLMAGVDIPVTELQLVIHPPKIKEIAMMGEQAYFMATQYLCLEKTALVQDNFLLSSLSNFQVLMEVLEQSTDKDKKTAVINLLKLLFPNCMVLMTKNSIILRSSEEDTKMIDTNNFDEFQNVLKQILCVNNLFQGENIIYNPINQKAKEIADKLMRGRKKAAEIKNQGKESNESILTRYVSILTVAKVTSLGDCLNCNLFQLFDLMERYSHYVEWDIDLRVRLAGGSPDKPVESWMRDLHSMKTETFHSGGMSDQIKVY